MTTSLISIIGRITKVHSLNRHTLVTLSNQASTIEVEIPDDILGADHSLTLQTYIQVTGALTTYLHDGCRSHRMMVKATSIWYPLPIPFDPTLHLAELLTTALYDKQKS